MAQSHLMLGADGQLWVVKFQNNPQHTRILANELIATQLAAALGLSVPISEVVEVPEWLVYEANNLYIDHGRGRRERCRAGTHFGSRLIEGAMPGLVVDFLNESQLAATLNLKEFAGMLCLDKWAGNCDRRQAVFQCRTQEQRYWATFIDQGFCFNAGEWTFPDAPNRGVYLSSVVYQSITGWESFEPWLTRLEELRPEVLLKIADTVPPEWYGGDPRTIARLIEQMLVRQGRVRELLEACRMSNREQFCNWSTRKRC